MEINNNFTSRIVALELKELGFDNITCFGQWEEIYTNSWYINQHFPFQFQTKQNETQSHCLAPLYQQAIMFLIEKYNIWIVPKGIDDYYYKFIIEKKGNPLNYFCYNSFGKTFIDGLEIAILKAINDIKLTIDIKTNIIPLVNEKIYVYGQYVKIIEIEKYNNITLLHLEESIVVPDSRYTSDIINLNEYIK